ncbi:MAG TPA: hypothetical protein VGE01_08940 [Fimbriimonas sp.]
MPTFSDIYRRMRRPYRVRWDDDGPPRLEGAAGLHKAFHRYGSLVDRVTRIFFSLDAETVDRILQTYRMRYGDGAYAYAKLTIQNWKPGQVHHVGQTVMRLLEIVPMYVDNDTKFELVQIMREETLRRLRQTRMRIVLTSRESLEEVMERVHEVAKAQLEIELPPGYLEMQAWLGAGDAVVFQRMIREGERRLLVGKLADFMLQLRRIQLFRDQIPSSACVEAEFDLPTARITVRVVQANRKFMEHDKNPQDDQGLLAKWSDLELESRFKAGEVSYPEYVLRNMDQFFTKEEQAELHKIAAMHGLELERQLMEIQIKGRTSDADLRKLVETLRNLAEKGIRADVVSRHETPSGHIEITAHSRKRFGCLPPAALLAFAGLLGHFLS